MKGSEPCQGNDTTPKRPFTSSVTQMCCSLKGKRSRGRVNLGITDQAYYRRLKEYAGMKIEQAKRLKELKVENARLKRAVADLTVKKSILKEVAERKC